MSRFGLFGSLSAQPGKREELLAILQEGLPLIGDVSGCEAYIVNVSPDDADKIWVYEAWRSEEDHNASLQDQGVREIISRAMPLIAGMGDRVVLKPLGGKGLPE